MKKTKTIIEFSQNGNKFRFVYEDGTKSIYFGSIEDGLRQLERLINDELISEDEYFKFRKEILYSGLPLKLEKKIKPPIYSIIEVDVKLFKIFFMPTFANMRLM